jgi:hypothetical protein
MSGLRYVKVSHRNSIGGVPASQRLGDYETQEAARSVRR